jgi:hypothetical protein
MVDRSWDREGPDQHVLGRHIAGLVDTVMPGSGELSVQVEVEVSGRSDLRLGEDLPGRPGPACSLHPVHSPVNDGDHRAGKDSAARCLFQIVEAKACSLPRDTHTPGDHHQSADPPDE